MSYQQFETACLRMQKLPGFQCAGGKSESEIQKAEEVLGLRFSRQCREFYQRYDYTCFDALEIFGISEGAGALVLEGNIVAYTLNDREEYGMPEDWIPFFNFGDGSLAYYDYSALNGEGEPKVIRAYYDGEEFCVIEALGEDFGSFLWTLVEAV